MPRAGVEPARIYHDFASGRHDARPGLLACLEALQPGNTLVLWKLDRLGRDLRHLVTTVEDLRLRCVGLKVLTGAGAQIDTTTANGRLAFGIFAAFADCAEPAVMRFDLAGPEDGGLVLQGIPDALYFDNGPVAKSTVFKNVMTCLGVQVMTHLPAGKDGRRTTARSKGKVERPFRTVKEAHETLYHFHKPRDEAEANLRLHRYIAHYNVRPHRSEPHSRIEDWLAHLPPAGLRAMCAWGRHRAFANRRGARWPATRA